MATDATPAASRPTSVDSRPVWAALFAAVAATYVFQMHTVGALKMAASDAGFGGGRRPGKSELIDLAFGALGPLDWLGVGLLAAACIALVVLQIRGRRVTSTLRAAVSEDGCHWPLLVLVTAWAVRGYADAGLPHLFDAKQHMAKTFAVTDILSEGHWPSWSWRWYAGFPLLRFYGPLSYVLAGLLGTVFGAVAGLKLFLIACHAVSGWAMYALGKRWSGSRQVALLACIVYVLSYQRFHTLMSLGRLPESLLWALFPIMLLQSERFLETRSWRIGAGAGLTLAAMILTHPVMGALGGLFAGLFAVLRIALRSDRFGRPVQTLGFGAATGAFAVLIAAFWMVPAMTERSHVLVDILYGGGTPGLFPTSFDPRDIPNLLRYGSPARGGSPLAYAGYSVVLLACMGLIRFVKTRREALVPALVLVGITVVYGCGGYFLSRAGGYVTPFLALLAGAAVLPSNDQSRPLFRRAGWALLACTIVVVDLLPLSVSSRHRPDLEQVRADLAAVAEQAGAARVVVVSLRGGEPEVSQWSGWDGAPLATLGGPFREGATGIYPWCMAALGRLDADLKDGGALEPVTVRSLRLLGVKYIVFDDGRELAAPPVEPGDGYSVSDGPAAVVLDGPAPLLAAGAWLRVDPATVERALDLPRLTDLPSARDAPQAELALQTLVSTFGEAASDAWPQTISVVGDAGRSGGAREITNNPGPDALQVHTVRFTDQEIELRCVASCDLAVLLPFAAYPGVSVAWLDEDVPPEQLGESVYGPQVVLLPAGEHRLVLRGAEVPRSGATTRAQALAPISRARGAESGRDRGSTYPSRRCSRANDPRRLSRGVRVRWISCRGRKRTLGSVVERTRCGRRRALDRGCVVEREKWGLVRCAIPCACSATSS